MVVLHGMQPSYLIEGTSLLDMTFISKRSQLSAVSAKCLWQYTLLNSDSITFREIFSEESLINSLYLFLNFILFSILYF